LFKDLVIENYEPKNYTPYVPPPCVYASPPANRTTPVYKHALINPADYDRSQFLDPEKKYKLYWSVDKQNLVFRAAVEVETTGWVGLGISEFGMEGADVFIGWVTDNVVHFADRFATAKALPNVDTLQDFYDIQGAQVIVSDSSSALTASLIGFIVAGSIVGVALFAAIIWKFKPKRKYAYLGTDEGETLFVTDTGTVKL